MKKLIVAIVCALLVGVAFAKGGSSSGGHGGGGGRGGSVSSSSAGKGGFSSSAGAPNSRPATASAPRTTTTTTTTTRSSTYNSSYVGGGMMYGGLGMGYGYTNGMLTGLIIGNMMHPHNTVVYNGGGAYNNNALLYPNGQVVSKSGQLVGTYENGVFNPISNGPIVAQSVPTDAMAPQPVVIQKDTTVGEVFLAMLLGFMCILFVIVLVRA